MRAAAESQEQMLAAIATWVEAWDTGNSDGLDAITAPDFKRTAPDQKPTTPRRLARTAASSSGRRLARTAVPKRRRANGST